MSASATSQSCMPPIKFFIVRALIARFACYLEIRIGDIPKLGIDAWNRERPGEYTHSNELAPTHHWLRVNMRDRGMLAD
ncbi:unnamed protein product [Onchocerca flexuosa]|uniref:Secreted protein n=1 Tax=Onchocerca flexuosa TaxID=387005 RepID=A0A183GYX1_9BILA|nr:unnamed protein product [Onchocerca flexuosa]